MFGQRLQMSLIAALTGYLFFIATSNSYNLVFSDQVDLLYGYIDGQDILTLFLQQHGPHRQGFGVLFMLPLMQLSDWNVSYLSHITIFLIFLSALFLMKSLREIGVTVLPSIASIFIFLSPGAVELITVTPNVSHSALPILFTTFVVFQIIKDGSLNVHRGFLASAAAIAGLFTGFGIFLFFSYAILTILFALREFLIEKRHPSVKLFAKYVGISFAMGLSFYFFLQNYNVSQGQGCSGSAFDNLLDVLIYAFAIAGMPLFGGNVALAVPAGSIVLLATVVTGIRALYLFIKRSDKNSLLVLLLITVSGTFIFSAALGRHCLSIDSALASRYYMFVILGYIGVIVSLDGWSSISRVKKMTSFLSMVLVCCNIIFIYPWASNISSAFYGHKNNFVLCRNNGESVQVCNDRFYIYPDTDRLESFFNLIEK